MGCGLKRILQLQTAIPYSNVSIWDTQGKDITNECKYSWSTDGVCWVNWTSLENYHSICKDLESDFYFRVLLFGDFDKISIDGKLTKCYNITIDNTSVFLEDFCAMPNLFQPYANLDCALMLQQQMSDSVVCMFGIPVYYIRINPQEGATDYTFKEHFLHYVEDIKQLKLMIEDGAMPSSNPKLNEFDFDWEVDWSTELSKTQFCRAFGDNAYPKNGDCVYIPMMKRMWMVNSAYDEKNEGLMWRSTTWKVALVKYTDSTNVRMDEFTDIMDGWTQLYENTFAEIERNEQERETGSTPLSNPPFSPTNLYNIFMEDAVRKQYTKQDITIIDKTYNHRSNVVGRNMYKFKNENGCVVYQKPICGDEGTLAFIIETGGNLKNEIERDIINFGEVQIRMRYDENEDKFNISLDDLSCVLSPFKSYMVHIKWSRRNFIKELCVYEYRHREDIPIYKLKPEMYWFDFENPVSEISSPFNNDFDMREKLMCQIHTYPLQCTNIKYYNKYLDKIEAVKESIKYTTQHDNCVINDLAREVESGHGYAVR